MINRLSVVTILVGDQEEALTFYTKKLGLEKRADETFDLEGRKMRWLTVAPKGQLHPEIYLALPFSPDQTDLIGTNTPWSFLTDDCQRDYEALQENGVNFVQSPAERPWGMEAVFQDPYGNPFSLLEPHEE